jgi:hypothetical protein
MIWYSTLRAARLRHDQGCLGGEDAGTAMVAFLRRRSDVQVFSIVGVRPRRCTVARPSRTQAGRGERTIAAAPGLSAPAGRT